MHYCIEREKFKDLTLEEIKFNLKERRTLLSKMVGSLYPAVIRDEILLLNQTKDKLRNENK